VVRTLAYCDIIWCLCTLGLEQGVLPQERERAKEELAHLSQQEAYKALMTTDGKFLTRSAFIVKSDELDNWGLSGTVGTR